MDPAQLRRLERFEALVRQAQLYAYLRSTGYGQAGQDDATQRDFNQGAQRARARADGYIPVCIGGELHKAGQAVDSVFSEKVRRCFSAVTTFADGSQGRILQSRGEAASGQGNQRGQLRRIEPGSEGRGARTNLLLTVAKWSESADRVMRPDEFARMKGEINDSAMLMNAFDDKSTKGILAAYGRARESVGECISRTSARADVEMGYDFLPERAVFRDRRDVAGFDNRELGVEAALAEIGQLESKIAGWNDRILEHLGLAPAVDLADGPASAEPTAKEYFQRFATLARQFKLYGYLRAEEAPDQPGNRELYEGECRAEDRVDAYVPICLAREMHKLDDEDALALSDKVRDAFSPITPLLEGVRRARTNPGPEGLQVRDGILARLEVLSKPNPGGGELDFYQRLDAARVLNQPLAGMLRRFSIGEAASIVPAYRLAKRSVSDILYAGHAVLRNGSDVEGLHDSTLSLESARAEIDQIEAQIAAWNDPVLARLQPQEAVHESQGPASTRSASSDRDDDGLFVQGSPQADLSRNVSEPAAAWGEFAAETTGSLSSQATVAATPPPAHGFVADRRTTDAIFISSDSSSEVSEPRSPAGVGDPAQSASLEPVRAQPAVEEHHAQSRAASARDESVILDLPLRSQSPRYGGTQSRNASSELPDTLAQSSAASARDESVIPETPWGSQSPLYEDMQADVLHDAQVVEWFTSEEPSSPFSSGSSDLEGGQFAEEANLPAAREEPRVAADLEFHGSRDRRSTGSLPIVRDGPRDASPAHLELSEPPLSPTHDAGTGSEKSESSPREQHDGQAAYLFPRVPFSSSDSSVGADGSNDPAPIPSIEDDDQPDEPGQTPQPVSEVRATLRSASSSRESSVDPLAAGSPIRRLARPAGARSSAAREIGSANALRRPSTALSSPDPLALDAVDPSRDSVQRLGGGGPHGLRSLSAAPAGAAIAAAVTAAAVGKRKREDGMALAGPSKAPRRDDRPRARDGGNVL